MCDLFAPLDTVRVAIYLNLFHDASLVRVKLRSSKKMADQTKQLQEKVWRGSIPLQITLSPLDCRTYEDSLPYLVSPWNE